jgi:hypothetical protein
MIYINMFTGTAMVVKKEGEMFAATISHESHKAEITVRPLTHTEVQKIVSELEMDKACS